MTALLIVGILIVLISVFTPITIAEKREKERSRSITNVIFESEVRAEKEKLVLERLDELNPPLYDLYDTVLSIYDEFEAPIYNNVTCGVSLSSSLTSQVEYLPVHKLYAKGYAWKVIGQQCYAGRPETKASLSWFIPEVFVKEEPGKRYSKVADSLGNEFYPDELARLISHCYLYLAESEKYKLDPDRTISSSRNSAETYFREHKISLEYFCEHLEEYVELYKQNPIEFKTDVTPSYLYKRINPAKSCREITYDMDFNRYYYERVHNLIEILTVRRLKARGYKRSPDGKHDSVWQERIKENNLRASLKEKYPEDFS